MPEYTLEKFIEIVLVIIAFIILALILTALKVGNGFFYAGCEGQIEGVRCTGNIETGCLGGEVNGVCKGSTIDQNITSAYCNENAKPINAISNPRCESFENYVQCVVTSYPTVKRVDENLSVCLYVTNGPVDVSGKQVNCLMNAQLSCDDFTQSTTPKCQDVPGCQPVNVIKRAMQELKPQKEKCKFEVGSVCLA
ncbi:MAG: hypothetical protein NTY99_01015 [DPANN group archaeon]|nr:hypothetical protein [DPANN group archaeon]